MPNNVYNIFVKTICGTGASQRTSHTIVTTPATNSTATSKFDCDAPPGLAVNFISAKVLSYPGASDGIEILQTSGRIHRRYTCLQLLLQTVLNNQFTVTNPPPEAAISLR
ncbi:MAG: hypothetical protein IPF93_14965 [Saprospiraceae bacterium]|nr:hypothetical protein [Saprospiraceae bacterium]